MLFGTSSKHLPPGPSGLPLVGNLFDIPKTDQWVYFYEQSKKYGSDVTTYKVLGTTIIVLNSREAIEALFEKEVEQYSSKPPRRMANISDLTMTLPFMDPGEVFSTARKQFWTGIGPSAVSQYDGAYERGSLALVRALAADLLCANLDTTVDASLGRVFLAVSTGYEDGPEEKDALTKMNDLAHFAADVLGDKYRTLDAIPFVTHLPGWTPFVGPKIQLGRQWKTRLHQTADFTVQLAKEGQSESVMSQELKGNGGLDEHSKMIAVTMNAGGMLATESAMLTFLLAMAEHPDVMAKAQAELDTVCPARLPTMADRKRLPYLDAVLSEVLRWVSIAPVIGREVTQDDHYASYLIPKGATIMANNWAISRDPSQYPSPETFLPTRFLTPDGTALLSDDAILKPMKYAFGFGHRTCPGRFLADALLFSHFAHVLKAFDVALPAKTEKAKRRADEQRKIKSNGAACRIEQVYVTLSPRAGAAALFGFDTANGAAPAATPAPAPAQNGHAANGTAAH